MGVLYNGKDSVPPSRKALLNTLTSRKRLLDDLCFGWFGPKKESSVFKSKLNKIGDRHVE